MSIRLQGFTRRPSGGFTLIELLVVIAIIAILAAMLFPVFARARESARKIQCLSNVKNIAMAVQMYLSDYNALPPNEHNQAAIAYIQAQWGNCNYNNGEENPYLKWPVILDEYIKNRDVWRCPNAKLESGAELIFGNPNYLAEHMQYPSCCGPCEESFPNGWGGAVTDSFIQQEAASARARPDSEMGSVFMQSIGANQYAMDLKPSQVNDPAWYAVVGDCGAQQFIWSPTYVQYPDCCRLTCAGNATSCPWSTSCTLYPPFQYFVGNDLTKIKQFTRHLGGSNLGFMDGHAKWFAAGEIAANSPWCDRNGNSGGWDRPLAQSLPCPAMN